MNEVTVITWLDVCCLLAYCNPQGHYWAGLCLKAQSMCSSEWTQVDGAAKPSSSAHFRHLQAWEELPVMRLHWLDMDIPEHPIPSNRLYHFASHTEQSW